MGYEKSRKKRKRMTDTILPAKPNDDWDKRWEVERDLESLTRAKAVQKDPKRMELCRKLAKEKLDESKRKKAEAEALIKMGSM